MFVCLFANYQTVMQQEDAHLLAYRSLSTNLVFFVSNSAVAVRSQCLHDSISYSSSATMGIDTDRFEGSVQESLICPLCSKVLEDPIVSECGHTFCSTCLQKKKTCAKCNIKITIDNTQVPTELVEKLGKLSIHCTHHSEGCTTVVSLEELQKHNAEECVFRTVSCQHRGCDFHCAQKDLESHMEKCDYRLVECKVCKARLTRKDMPAHQAVKRCFELQNKRKRVQSARKLSHELKEHRVEMLHHRHLTDQADRRIFKEHYERDSMPQRRRAMSAGPVLLRGSIQTRVGSATLVPHYSRNLRSATLETCRGCSNKFLSGRRPSARRHSHANVCFSPQYIYFRSITVLI